MDPEYSDSKPLNSYFTHQLKKMLNDTCSGGLEEEWSGPPFSHEQGLRGKEWGCPQVCILELCLSARTGFKSIIAAQKTSASQTLVSNTGESLGGGPQGQLAFTDFFPSASATFMLSGIMTAKWGLVLLLRTSLEQVVYFSKKIYFLPSLDSWSPFASEKDKDLSW